jgi:hypothetical protein
MHSPEIVLLVHAANPIVKARLILGKTLYSLLNTARRLDSLFVLAHRTVILSL